MGIADRVDKKTKSAGAGVQMPAGDAVQGDELATALQVAAQGQIQQMASLITAFDSGMNQNAERMADYFASALNGQVFAQKVLAKVAERHQPVELQQGFTTIDVELPTPPAIGSVRRAFMSLFGSEQEVLSPFRVMNSEEDESDDD